MKQIEETPWLEECWYLAFAEKELDRGQTKTLEICNEPILVGKSPNGDLFALKDTCPHRAAPLSAGQLREARPNVSPIQDATGMESKTETRQVGNGKNQDNCTINGREECDYVMECPYHGWQFSTVDGRCVHIPSLTTDQCKSFDSYRIKVKRYPVVSAYGLIWVFISAAKKADEQPRIMAPTLPIALDQKPKIEDASIFDCSVDHAAIGLMDPAHGPFVHKQWWWRSEDSIHEKEKKFEPRPYGFAMASHQPSSNSRAYRLIGGSPQTEITFTLPSLRYELIKTQKYWILALTCLTPQTTQKTRICQFFYSNYWLVDILKPIIRVFARRFLNQDGDMVNLQQTRLRYQPNLMLIDDADQQAKWYYQLKKEWRAHIEEDREFQNPVKPKTLHWRS